MIMYAALDTLNLTLSLSAWVLVPVTTERCEVEGERWM